MLDYPRFQLSLHLGMGGPVGAIYSSSKNGWFNEELFFQWLQHFCGRGTQSYDDPLLLTLDNHAFCSEPAFTAEIMKKLSPFHLTLLTIDSHVILYFMDPWKVLSTYLRRCGCEKVMHYKLAELFTL